MCVVHICVCVVSHRVGVPPTVLPTVHVGMCVPLCVSRDSVSKAYYAMLFEELVDIVNAALKPPGTSLESSSATIGLLDIFGSEVFTTNTFEQVRAAGSSRLISGYPPAAGIRRLLASAPLCYCALPRHVAKRPMSMAHAPGHGHGHAYLCMPLSTPYAHVPLSVPVSKPMPISMRPCPPCTSSC